MESTWEKDTRPFHSGKVYRVGKWIVGHVEWVSGSRNDPKPLNYGAYCNLPGMKELLGKYETEIEAQTKVENAVNYWQTKLVGKLGG